jgi:hypothetical protein
MLGRSSGFRITIALIVALAVDRRADPCGAPSQQSEQPALGVHAVPAHRRM